MLPNKERVYFPSLSQWRDIELMTEFSPNETIEYVNFVAIDFNKSVVCLKNKEVPFDCLSEDQFVHVCNGGYYEDAPKIKR